MPNTRPGVELNENGICIPCVTHNQRPKIDWSSRLKNFEIIVDRAKAHPSPYDCLIPVSGGKDSTWQVVKCLEYGLNPLCFTQKVPLRTELGQKNLDNLISLGADHIEYMVNPEVEKKFVRKAFIKYGSAGLPMHMAMYRMTLNLACKFNIPYVIWGENSSIEYGSSDKDISTYKMDSKWLKKYGVSHGTEPQDWISDDLSLKELTPYFGPSDEDLDAQKIEAIFLGSYFQWDTMTSFKVAKKNGFTESLDGPKIGYYNFADLDDDIISIHHMLKWYKFGFTRAFDNLCIEIRNNRMTRREAIKKLIALGKQFPLQDIENFCNFIEMPRNEFWDTLENFRNLDIWHLDEGKWKIEDFLIEDWSWD